MIIEGVIEKKEMKSKINWKFVKLELGLLLIILIICAIIYMTTIVNMLIID